MKRGGDGSSPQIARGRAVPAPSSWSESGLVAAALLALCLAWAPGALGQGAKLWEFTTEGAVNSSAAIGPDGAVYFGSADGRVYALNSNGSVRWTLRTGGAVYSSPALGSDGTVYVGSLDGKLYALGVMGAVRWTFPAKDGIYGSPALGLDGTVYIGSMDGKLYAVAPNGVRRWEFATGAGIFSSPIVGLDGVIYVGSRDGGFYAVRPDGARKWRWATGNWVESSAAIGPDGTVYVGSLDGKVYALNPDGTEQWHYAAGAAVYASPAVGLDGMVYVANNDGRLHALTPQGTNKWTAILEGRVGYSSVAIAADGALYVAATDGKLYAIEPNGQRRWTFPTLNVINYSSPNIRADGAVFIGSSDGKLYTVSGGNGPAGGVWPMFRRDARHTASLFVERILPAGYSPGAEMTVTLVATPPPGVNSYAVEDVPPANWQVGEVSDNGYFDPANRRVRFGPFLDDLSRRLSYRVTPPLGESGRKVFAGNSAAGSSERTVGGTQVLDPTPLHPADNQPVDNWLTIGELTAYGAAWKRGTAWQVGPNPIPSVYLTWAIGLWEGGEFYCYDTNAVGAPQLWVNPPDGVTTNAPPAALPAGTLSTKGTAVATMPLTFTPGSNFVVQIAVTPLTNVVAYAVEDCPPTNWTVAQISEGGLFDRARAKVKWGPFFDHLPRTLTYRVTPATNAGKFYGLASFDGSTGEITGQRETVATGPSTTGSWAERELPPGYARGVKLVVTLQVWPNTNVAMYAVEDIPPANWQVGQISDNGYFDAVNRRVRYGPFSDHSPRTLTYEVTPSLSDSALKLFSGSLWVDGLEQMVGGDFSLSFIPLHPADTQPIDAWLTVGELTAYAAAWKRGTAWPNAPSAIPVSYLTQALELWLGGECYGYNTNVTNAPLWWTNLTSQLFTNLSPPVLAPGTIATNGQAVATMPLRVPPGASFTVTLAVTPATNVAVYAVEDQPPAGWQVGQITAAGTYDGALGKVKWGPFFDPLPRTLAYQVTAPANAADAGKFSGVAAFDGARGEVSGGREVRLGDGFLAAEAVTRHLPPGYSPGVTLVVSLQVTTLTNCGFYIVEDLAPPNWQVGQVSHDGAFDRTNRTIRFGPYFDGQARTLTYELTPPANETGREQLAGVFSVDGVQGQVMGDTLLDMIPLHPADTQPIDAWLTVGELTAYAAAWKRGTAWPNAPSPIPVSYLTQALELWLGGECYGYNTNVTNAPLWWTNLTSQLFTNLSPPILAPGTIATNGQAVATMPLTTPPGLAFTVSITVTPATNVAVYAVEDQPPTGWQVSQVAADGSFDQFLGKVKWGPFFDSLPRTLTYQVTAPADAAATGEFSGVAAFDGARGEIGGQREIRLSSTSVPAGFVTRKLPSGYSPGAELVVSLQVIGSTNCGYYVVEDSPPPGWPAGQVSDNGVFDGTRGTVRFGPFFDGAPRLLSYALTPPASASGPRQFSGTFSVDGVQGQVQGDTLLDLIPLHPADAQPIDGWLTVGELTAYAAAWKLGAAWTNPPTPVPLAYLTQAVYLWQSGELYRYDTNFGPGPFWWVAAAPGGVSSNQVPLPPDTAATNGLATSDLPATLQPGGSFTVTITIVPATNVTVYAVEDQPPAGWQPVELTGEGLFDPASGKVKWGPFFDSLPRTLSYRVTAPADAAGLFEFSGVAAFDGAAGIVGGARATVVFGSEMPGGFVQRQLPAAYSPGAKLVVGLQTAAVTNLSYYAVVDAPPANWQVGQISHGGWFDPVNCLVKFGPYFDGEPRLLSYEATPPLGESGARQFSGAWVMDDLEGPTGGDDTISPAPLHPADTRPIDSWLTIGEMTAYGAAWKRGAAWAFPPTPIPAAYLARAIGLWLGGEYYGVDARVTNAPLWWVNLTNQVPSALAPPPCAPGASATNGAATAALPRYFDAATPFTVTITVVPATNVLVFAVEDQPPDGWLVSQITGGGVCDQKRNKIKWGPFYDAAQRTLTYQVTPPAQAAPVGRFTGAAAFDGAVADFSGRRQCYLNGSAVAPSLESLRYVPKRGLELSLSGFAGELYQVQFSTNLIRWLPLATVTNTAATVNYLDAGATNYPQRFYRVFWP